VFQFNHHTRDSISHRLDERGGGFVATIVAVPSQHLAQCTLSGE